MSRMPESRTMHHFVNQRLGDFVIALREQYTEVNPDLRATYNCLTINTGCGDRTVANRTVEALLHRTPPEAAQTREQPQPP